MDIKILDELMEIAWELDDIERDTMVRSLKKSAIDKKLDKSVNSGMYINLLEQFYYALIHGNEDTSKTISLPHSSVFYVRAVIEEDKKFIDSIGYTPSLAEVEKAMYLEGMLPWGEYSVPSWFARKHTFRKDKK
jgi:hypothetical protein|tara:strand:- start:57 stop:458 length:402 start_codon:yes stop_codon:yes gene_type:complete